MPTEFEIRLQNLKYISMVDFSKQIDEIKDMDKKIAFTVEYLLSQTEATDCALDEAIEIARMKIADAIVEYKEKAKNAVLRKESKEAFNEPESKTVDLKAYGNVLDNKKLDEFLAYPSLYLRKAGNQRLQELKNKIENEDIVLKTEEVKTDVFEHNINILTEYKMRLDLKESERSFLHINARLENKFGSSDALNKAFKDSRPGFFSRMFNTTSLEGRNLLAAYKGFNNYKNPLYGRKDTLVRAANAYIKHIYPNWKPESPLPNEQEINQLSGTQKARMILANAILESVKSEEKMLKEYMPAISNVKEIEFDFHDKNEIKKTNIIDLDKDLNDSMDNSIVIEAEDKITNSDLEV